MHKKSEYEIRMAAIYSPKILYYSAYTSIHTGSPRALIDLITNIDAQRFRVCLMLPQEGELGKTLEAIVRNIYIRKSMSLSTYTLAKFPISVCSLLLFCVRHKIDLVHLNGAGWRESCLLAARALNIPVVLHLHNPYPENEIRGNFNFSLADRIIVVSESMKDNFRNHPRVLEKMVVIHNGVDLKDFHPREPSVAPFHRDERTFVIGFVGQISKRKGLGTLIEASPGIIAEYPHAIFVVVGSDAVGEAGLTKEMQELALKLGVSGHFSFLGKRNDIPEVMNWIDLLVVPSRAEPFGKVIIEGMACRKCVIASRVGGIPEIIKDGENGILVPPGDCERLEQSILTMMRNKELRMRLAESGYETAKDRFAIQKVVEKTENLYMELILDRGNKRRRGGAQQ